MAVEAAGIVTYTRFDEFRLVCSYANYQRYLAELPKFGAPWTALILPIGLRFGLLFPPSAPPPFAAA